MAGFGGATRTRSMSPGFIAGLMALLLLGSTAAILQRPYDARARLRAWLVRLIVLPAPAAPLVFGDTTPFGRLVLAMGGVLVLVRSVDLSRDPRSYPLAFRLWFTFTAFDGRTIRRDTPMLDKLSLLRLLGYGSLFWTVFAVFASGALSQPHAWQWPLRWLLGAVLVYSLLDAVAGGIHVVYRGLGVVVEPVHRAPILSRSVQEFWGERWNRIVHQVLVEYSFKPLGRKRLRLAIMGAFALSALLHFWILFMSAGLARGLVMASFFLLQGGFVVLERKLRVARWREVPARAWTVLCVLGTSPLFVEPMLAVWEF